jgi:gliding motility-associated-like protein
MDNNGCVSLPATDYIRIQQPAPKVIWDTTVIIGETVNINAHTSGNFTYTWTPVVKDLSCLSCNNPISSSTVDVTYSVTLEDSPLGCFKTVNVYSIKIDPRTTIDVPSAFTPNGDFNNEKLFAKGWGVRKLLYFKVFNRWGQLLFETNDLSTGWDGTFKGVPQNMETYVYQVSVETYLNDVISKSGTVKLIR